MQNHQKPHFRKIKKRHLDDKELKAPIDVVLVRISGEYTKRGEHRKEVISDHYDAEIEVPAKFNKGHIKLAANRYIRKELHGIRVRTFELDEDFEPKPLQHKRMVKDFMSTDGLRDNASLKREYDNAIKQREQEAEADEDGDEPRIPQGVQDETDYGDDGLPKFSGKRYVSQ